MNDLRRLFDSHSAELENAATDALRSGWWLNGARGKTFAADFGQYVGVEHCILVANGTDALELALSALVAVRQPTGREVVVVANAGGYGSTACWHNGLVPHFVDIDPDSQLMSLPAAIGAVGEQTAAVIVTHLYGGVVDVRALRTELDKAGYPNVPIIEDCAQAHGARVNGQIAGGLGDISTFSFYPTKNLGALGDGGAICTGDTALADHVRRLHQYGWVSKYHVGIPHGRNSRMDEVQAALLSVMLDKLDDRNAKRRAILDKYRSATGRRIKFVDGGGGSVAHLAVLLCSDRDLLRAFLKQRGVETDIHYPVLDCDQEGWQGNPMTGKDNLASARLTSGLLCSVPCHPDMTEAEIDQVTAALAAWEASA